MILQLVWGVFLCFLLPQCGASPTNWATLTADQIRNLDPSLFSNITESELASIPSNAFPGN